jgi:S1-C subfamily serine protease
MKASSSPSLATIALLCACGSEPTPPPARPATAPGPGPTGEASAAPAAQNPGVSGRAQARVGSLKLADRRHRTALAPDTLDQVKGGAAPPPKTAAEIYRAVAPATIIVRVPDGMGSGIVIDPAGWALTNHHVIDRARGEDFKHKVTVLVGELSKESGGMQRTDKELEAWVYKSDKLRDLALIKIENPPAGLAAVRLSADKPVPGSAVTAIGHAGAGMLWALKSGQISAMGKLAEQLAQLASFKDDEDGRKARDTFKKYVNSKNLGLIIQSTCNILPGDSGGPLVNDRGELVGLNAFSRRDGTSGGLLSFHIHLDELRAFAADRPEGPAQLLPDPWLDGGADLSFEDADLDGSVDVLLMEGRRACPFCPRQSGAVMLDLDQNSYAGRDKLPELHEVFDKHDFDAEVVHLQVEDDVFVWYDTDNDGRHDVLLYDEKGRGRVSAAYRIDAGGGLRRDEALSSGKPFKTALFASPVLATRFANVGRAAFTDRLMEGPTPAAETLPQPVGNAGRGFVVDLDDDGRFDAVRIVSPFSSRLLIDPDTNFVPHVGRAFNLAEVPPERIDVEVSVVTQSTRMWVWYDTDDDRRFDLALHAPSIRSYVALEAWRVSAAGERQPAPEHVGRKLLRADLLQSKPLADAVRKMIAHDLLPIMSAVDDGLASFPDPVKDHRGAGYELVPIQGAAGTVVAVAAQGSDGYLLDLDRNTLFVGKPSAADIEKKVTGGKFDAELAYFHRADVAWAFYDTTGMGKYDVVLVTTEPAKGKATAGYRVPAGGAAKLDAALAGGPLIRASLYKLPPIGKRLATLAKDLFADAMVEP